MSGLVDGARFALDAPTEVEAVWGDGSGVLWAEGEPLMIAGPDGVGKTAIGQQLALRRAGIGASELLGHSIAPDPRRVLYLALDRPRQAARSMRRMVSEDDREALAARLVVWEGELPFNLVTEPPRLLALAQEHDAGTIVIDSLKDTASKLGEEEGHAINRAVQLCVAAGVETLALHHQRKAQSENKKPRTLADVYGSRWLTAGCGSVLMLWGEAGDPIVELAHLKQPADEVGPLTLLHDNVSGTTSVAGAIDVVDVLGSSSVALSAKDVASRLFSVADPGRNDVAKAKRKLTAAVSEGRAERLEPEQAGGSAHWTTAGGAREGCTGVHGGVHAGRVHAGLYEIGPVGTPLHNGGVGGTHNGHGDVDVGWLESLLGATLSGCSDLLSGEESGPLIDGDPGSVDPLALEGELDALIAVRLEAELSGEDEPTLGELP